MGVSPVLLLGHRRERAVRVRRGRTPHRHPRRHDAAQRADFPVRRVGRARLGHARLSHRCRRLGNEGPGLQQWLCDRVQSRRADDDRRRCEWGSRGSSPGLRATPSRPNTTRWEYSSRCAIRAAGRTGATCLSNPSRHAALIECDGRRDAWRDSQPLLPSPRQATSIP